MFCTHFAYTAFCVHCTTKERSHKRHNVQNASWKRMEMIMMTPPIQIAMPLNQALHFIMSLRHLFSGCPRHNTKKKTRKTFITRLYKYLALPCWIWYFNWTTQPFPSPLVPFHLTCPTRQFYAWKPVYSSMTQFYSVVRGVSRKNVIIPHNLGNVL